MFLTKVQIDLNEIRKQIHIIKIEFKHKWHKINSCLETKLVRIEWGITEDKSRSHWSVVSLSMQRFWATDGNRTCAVFLFNLSSHYHIYIVQSLFTSRDY